MTPSTHKLLLFFQANRHKAILLDWLVRKSGKSRGTVLRIISQVKRRCPRGWRLRVEYTTDDMGFRWTWYRYCPGPEYYRKQQRLEGVA